MSTPEYRFPARRRLEQPRIPVRATLENAEKPPERFFAKTDENRRELDENGGVFSESERNRTKTRP